MARYRRGSGNHCGAVRPEHGRIRNGDLVRLRGFDRNVAQSSAAEWRRRLQEITKRDRCGALQRAVRDRAGSAIEVSQSRASVI